MISRDACHTGELELVDLSDDELAAAAAVGDSEAFALLVRRMSPVLLRYMRRMVSDRQVAEDLAQETLLDTWKALPDFAFRSTFRTWMFAVAHRKTVDHYRRRRDVPVSDERFVDMLSKGPEPADSAEHSALMDALRAELENLPYTSRAAWWLKEVEGLTIEEIAQVLRVSTGSVRGHLQRSRKFLVARLAPWQPGAKPPDDDIVTERGRGERP